MDVKPPVAYSRAIACLALWAASGALQPSVGAERWQVGVVGTSDYVQRGLSQNYGDPALIAGATYRFDSGVYAGVWGSTVSNSRTALRDAAGRFEVNYLAGYSQPWGEAWEFDVTVLHYEYPDSDATVDYGHTELAASVGYRGRVWLTAAASRDATVYTRRGPARNVSTYAWELSGEHPLGARLSWVAGAGYLDFRTSSIPGYAYFNTGLAARFPRLDAELQYVDTAGGERLFGRRLAGPRVVLSVMVAF